VDDSHCQIVIYFFFTHSFSKDQKTEIARRSTLTASEMRDELDGVKEAMHEEKITKMDIAADMSRQYKSMQTQMEMRIQFLEEEVKRLTSLLDETKLKLHHVTVDRDKLRKEKEEQYEALIQKMKSIEQAYESILQEALDNMAVKLEVCRTKWMKESVDIQKRNFQLLQEFGSIQ
jgi:hypothetical protein